MTEQLLFLLTTFVFRKTVYLFFIVPF